MKVKVSAHTYEYVTEEADPDDSWDRDNTGKDISGWTAESVKPETPNSDQEFYWDRETFVKEVDDDATEVYVVYARYSTGDTFGSSAGEVHILDIFDDEDDAVDLKEKAKEFDNRSDYHKVIPFAFDWNGATYNIPWAGYFEHLEHLGIETVEIS